MEVICAGISDIGRKRETNQDTIYISNADQFYVVADGMGGHSGGDLASTMAVKYMSEFIKSQNDPQSTPGKSLKESIMHANNQVKNYADLNENLRGMGTTVVSVLFGSDNIAVGNVGDSRAYLINEHQIFQLTKDHSMVQEKVNMGIYTRAQAADDPHKNVLSRTVGYELDIEIDIFSYKPKAGDLILLCSDGLHGKVSDEDILYLISNTLLKKDVNYTNVRDCVQTLVRQANENGGQDNISVILAAVC
ncbi:Stp1/IreP family PP2C-type Ser/Thr phosphatase [Bacteriovorax sp. DB6_IX]|uniref:Stp1/IreP family PP2C-type Ser/Thr phosphatase n=1 Tax=Bacteriovorax sp. DB6_IX TaxID=1353530 RepID=UPI000389FB29|nr:Stp1/IreP family PP2C-type Ser/Thr phosphatase [Bacteriovorax sp. DB6_IX]EQC51801.1 SpoIIE-like protein phosphatase domain protein [Bacteriovorax sp. DB6_IX]